MAALTAEQLQTVSKQVRDEILQLDRPLAKVDKRGVSMNKPDLLTSCAEADAKIEAVKAELLGAVTNGTAREKLAMYRKVLDAKWEAL